MVFLHLAEKRSLGPFQEALRIVVSHAELCGQEKDAIAKHVLPRAFDNQDTEQALVDLYKTFAGECY